MFDELLRAVRAKRVGNHWKGHCPAHDDQNPSLSISHGDNGQPLVHCHAGCTQDEVIGALKRMGVWPDSERKESKPQRTYPTAEAAANSVATMLSATIAGEWIYQGIDGREVFRVVRFNLNGGQKEFRPFHQTANGWVIGDPPGKLPLYRLPELVDATTVYIAEGEKCADALYDLGLPATTSAHGSKSAHRSDWTPLAGKTVIILPDNDEPGRAYAYALAQILMGLGPPATVKILKLPNLPPGGDILDYLELRDSTEADDIRLYLEHLADSAHVMDANSIRAPIGKGVARIEFSLPILASELKETGDIDWVWVGYAARGFITLVTGLWKAGKTTLIAHLVRALGTGDDVGVVVKPGRVLVVAEESEVLWTRRRDELRIGDHAEFDIIPFLGRPDYEHWTAYVDHLAVLATDRKYDAIIIDTLASFSPVSDENSAAEMMKALAPLRKITQSGAGVILVHHPRKGDAAEGQASRGSGALPGFVDIIVELRRYNSKEHDDARRVLTAFSRLQETPAELVIELTDHGYVACGTRSLAAHHDRMDTIETLLSPEEPGVTVDQLVDTWPSEHKPSKRTLMADLKKGAEDKRWCQSGEGVKGNPLRFRANHSIRASPIPIGARIESEVDEVVG